MVHKIKIEREVPESQLSDVLIAAFDDTYGGCWYWAQPVQFDIDHSHQGEISPWIAVTIQEEEEQHNPDVEQYKIDYERLITGINLILSGQVPVRSDLKRQIETIGSDDFDFDVDADAADCIVQASVFGNLRYG